MKKDIILAGVGGQGILSIAAAIGLTARMEHLFIKQSEVHGMSQRGGEVQAHLRLSNEPVSSDLIPEGTADMIISMEPMECLRYVNFLKPEGWIICNSRPFMNIDNYPEMDMILNELNKFKNHLILDTEEISRKCGSAKASNMVLLGAASIHLGLKTSSLQSAIESLFGRKGDKILLMNLNAFDLGMASYKDTLKESYAS